LSIQTATAEAALEVREGSLAAPSRDEVRVPATKPRMMLIVNPKATTVSARLKRLVAYALQARFDVQAVETQGPNHATAITREAAADGYDLAVAFGGDGTVNEAANGLAGTAVPLTVLPGGCTNVVCRMLGVPTDIIDATEHVLSLADRLAEPRAIDLGSVNGRYFVSSTGIGMDAATTRWVDERAHLKRRAGPLFFSFAGLVSFQRYRRRPRRLAVEVDGWRAEGVSAVFQNSDPYTFYNSRPVRLCDDQTLTSGTLSAVALREASGRHVPALAWRLLTTRPAIGHPVVESFCGLSSARVRALPDEDGEITPLPVQVDGDWIGDAVEVEVAVHPRALLVAA
jgi:diacylglycerol kinase family enzyme